MRTWFKYEVYKSGMQNSALGSYSILKRVFEDESDAIDYAEDLRESTSRKFEVIIKKAEFTRARKHASLDTRRLNDLVVWQKRGVL